MVLGRRGIVRSLNMPLNDEEKSLLLQSAETLKALTAEAESVDQGD